MKRATFILNIIGVVVGIVVLATPLWPLGLVLIPLALLLLVDGWYN